MMKRMVLGLVSLFAVACGSAGPEGDAPATADLETAQAEAAKNQDALLLLSNSYRLLQSSSTVRNSDGSVTVELKISSFLTNGVFKKASTTIEIYQLPDEEGARSTYLNASGAFDLPASARVYSASVAYTTEEPDRFNMVTLTLPGRGHLVSVVGRESLAADGSPTNNIRTLTRLSTRTGGDF